MNMSPFLVGTYSVQQLRQLLSMLTVARAIVSEINPLWWL